MDRCFANRTALLTALLASALVAGGTVGPANSVAAPTQIRYATPAGQGESCTKDAPCGIRQALNFAPDGSTVLIGPGEYDSTVPLGPGYQLDEASRNVVVKGVGSPPPTLRVSGPYSLVVVDGTVSNLRIEGYNDLAALKATDSSVDRVRVTAYASDACFLADSSMQNSVCAVRVATNDSSLSGVVVAAPNGKTTSATLRNVTAVGDAPDGFGVFCFSENAAACSLHIVNSLVVGSSFDVRAEADDNGSATVVAQYSRLRDVTTDGNSAVKMDDTDIDQPVHFVDANSGDYRLPKASATIDSGLDGGSQGAHDLAGAQRIVGKAVDIGAYEYLPRPAAATPTVLHRGRHSVRFHVAVNTDGLTGRVVVSARRPGFTLDDNARKLRANRHKHTVTLSATGLARHTSYRLFVTVTDAGGSARSKSVQVRTT